MKKIRIGTRRSQLALAQVDIFIKQVENLGLNIEWEIVKVSTIGDRVKNRHLLLDGGVKGMFTREIDERLINGEIDVAVHSLKDVAAIPHEAIVLQATLPAADPRDVLISRSGGINDLPSGATIGTSSIRRKLFLNILRPDLKVVECLGNVNTRLKKFEQGEVDALVIAYSGLERLGLSGYITQVFDIETMLPAICQGIIGIFTSETVNERLKNILSQVNCRESFLRASCERNFAAAFGASCQTPIAGHAILSKDSITLHGCFIHEPLLLPIKKTVTGDIKDYSSISNEVAKLINIDLESIRHFDSRDLLEY